MLSGNKRAAASTSDAVSVIAGMAVESRERKRRKKTDGALAVGDTTLSLLVFPVELIVLVASYFSMMDERTLSHCSKSYRSIMRTANLIRYRVSNESCERYVDDLSYRDVVDSRGHVWEFKLFSYDALVDVTFLSRVHTVELRHCQRVTDVSPLSSVHPLTLDNMHGVRDVSALSSVHTLTLSWMSGVTDVSALSSVHTLRISRCSHIPNMYRVGVH